MTSYAILDEEGNVLNTIVADEEFLASQGFTRYLVIDQWLDGSMGPIDTTRRWDEKAGGFVDSQTARAKQSREQADRPSDAEAMARAVADKVAVAQAERTVTAAEALK